MKKAIRILIVEDNPADAELAERAICKVLKGCTFHLVETRKDFLKALETFQPDVIVADYALPRFDGLTALKLARKHAPLTPVIMWTGATGEDIAVDCLKAGANNYVLKENIKRLGPAVLRALEDREALLARKQAEEKYQAIFENSVVGIFQSTPQGRYLNVNAAMARIYGYDSPEEMTEAVKDIKQQIYVDADRRAEFIELLNSQNTVEHYEGKNYRKDRSIIWTSTSARAARDTDGNVLYYEGFITDITPRKKAEEELKERERQLTILFSNLPGPVYRCQYDANYTMDFISDGIRELSGYTAEDFQQHRRDYGKLIHAEDREQVWAEIQTAVEQKQPFELTYRIVTATGEEKWVWEKGQGVYDPKGQLQALEGFITDITARKRAEEVIQTSEKRFRALIENGPDNISLLAADGTLLWESPATSRMLGYAPDEFVGRNIFELIHPDDFEWTRALYSKLVSEPGSHQSGVFRLHHSNGTWHWVEAIATNLLNEPGINAVVINYRDITEHKQVEEALREERNLLRTLIDNIPDRIYAMDIHGRKTLSNTADWQASGGKTMEDVIGKAEFDIYPPDLAEEFWQLDQAVLDSGQPVINYEEPGLDVQGNRVSILTTKIPLRDSEGKVLGLVGIGRDITERKQVEEKLRQSENRYRLAVKATNDVIWETNLQPKQLFWSENAQIVFGYTPEEVDSYETWWDDHLHPDDRARVLSKMNSLIESNESLWMDEYRFQLKNGSYAYISDRGYIERDRNGTPLRMIGAMTNITERKQAEDKLRESENRLFMALSGAQMSVWEWDLKTNQITWSPEFFRITGVNAEQFGGSFESFTDLIHIDDLERVRNAAEKAMKGQTLFAEEFRIICPDGEVRWLSNLGQAEYDSTGTYLRLIGTVQDVTQRKQAETERQALLEIMQGIANTEDLHELLQLIHHSVARVVYAKNFFIVLHQPEKSLFEEIYSVDQYDPPAPPDKLEKSLTSYVFRTGEPLLLTKVLFDELIQRGEARLVGTDSASWLGVPLKTSGRTIGVMVVQDYEIDNRYSERDKQFLASIATQVALAIERKHAETALRESEEHYRAIFEGVQDAIFVESLDGKILNVNEQACEMFGYSHGEFLTKTVRDLVPDGNFILMADDKNSLLTAEPHETLNRRANGEIFPIDISGRLQVIDGETVFLVVVRDITERKQAEEALREAETKYRTLVEQLPAVTYLDVIDESLRSGEFKTSYISPQVEGLLGYPPHAFQTDPDLWTELIHPDDRERVLARIAAYYQHMGFYHDEYRMRTWQGNEIWIRDEAIVVRGNGNKQPFSQGVVFDITERKRMEVAEREQRVLSEALRDTAEILSSTLDYGEVLDHILAAVGRVVPHDAATIMLINGEQAHVVRLHGYDQDNFNTEIMGLRLPLAKTTNLRQMLETRQPVVVYDTHSYPDWQRMPATDWLRSSVGAPILIYGEIIGFICLDGQEPGFFTPVHAERLEAFANQAALAIHNARLLQQAQEEIAERKHAEEELRFEKDRLEKIAAAVPGLIGSLRLRPDGSGHMPFASPAIQDVYGFLPAELQEDITPFFARVHAEDLPQLHAAIQESSRSLLPWYGEFRYHHPTKGEVWIEGRSMPLREEDGSTIWHGFLYDITERKRAEQELRASEERFRQLADNIQEVFWMTDAETGEEIYLSPAAEAIWRQPLETLRHEPNALINSVFPEDQPRVLENLEKEKAGEKAELEYRIVRPDGSLRWIWDRAFPIFDDSGKVKRIAGISADITDRKQAEYEIRRRAEENSILLKTSLALTNLDLQTTLQTVGDSAKNLFAADGCRIFLMEPEGKSLRCVLALQENLNAFADLRIRVGEGVTGSVAESGQAEIVNRMQNDARAVQVPGTPDEEEAIMFAPLREREETIGVLSIRRTGSERPFELADLAGLEALASIAASAVSNARLFAETQRRLAELEALYENGLAVGRLLRPNQIGHRVINTFARYLRWHHVTISLREESSDNLELVAFNLSNLEEEERTNAEQHFIAPINKVGQGLSGWVTQTGLPLRAGHVQAHPQYIDTHTGIQSGLYMPLKVGERVIGVISVESEAPDAFTEQDERLLATLASQAAIAFENARLYQAIEQELSERKRAEEALRTSETHYRELADSITDILFELDHELRYTHWNKASEMFSGISAQDAIGRPMQELFETSEEQSRREEIYISVLKERRAKSFETEILAKGQKRALEINAYPSARGVSVVAKDVTDRKRAEIIMQKRFALMEYSAHHSLEELMQRTVDEVSELTGSAIGFFHFVEENKNALGRQTWSTDALKLFNVPASEGTHLPLDQAGVWAEAVHQRRPLIQNDYGALTDKKGFAQGHVPITREIVVPIIRNEKVMAVMGIGNKPQEYTSYDLEVAERLADYAWDITERKQMQVALEIERNQLAKRVEERTSDLSQANSNLARALRVKDEFLANMSHELRTPLNAILGLSESLGEQIAGPLNEKQQKYITTISESGHHLLALINDILDLAKIEAGQITLDINKVDIHQVCQASLRMIKQLAQKKNQDVVLEIGDGVELMWADERRLKQMIVNLLGNAVKFTPEHGKIGLRVHGDQVANKISITVWDNGIGIKEDDLARLFQPFVQLDSGLAREATGTGLGLALVAQMARLHGGSVSAMSEPGKGSRFSIVLPWEPGLVMDASSRLRTTGKFPAIKPDETNRPTILLVEDSKEVIMMIRDYLELAGYTVVVARDGVEAITQARLVHPDLILMDVMMPRMDGFEATRKLRSEPEFKYTPIIALTALAMPSDRERCLAAGMDEYISKPINFKALVRMIQSCLFSSKESRP